MSEPMSFRENLPLRFQKIKYGKFGPKDIDYPIHLHLKENDVTVQERGSDIVTFLRGKHVLITGATGFLGKMFVEKLLRSCEDITIYVIIREKKGKLFKDRTEELLNSYVFHKVKKLHPDFRKNVISICGDISQPNLGLSEKSRELLEEKINIIYHVAASIRFDEPLRKAVNTNVLGTSEIIELAKKCKKLESFTHVSTAYSNSHLRKIDERFYEPIVAAEKLVTLTNLFSDDVLDKITPSILGDLPNTYTLTKQSTEYMVKNNALGLPACICRPSIVISSNKEPFRGWGENLFGPIGYILATAFGIVHVQEGNKNNKADLVPADYVINQCIAASYRTFLNKDTSNIPIYNYVSGKYSFTWGKIEKYVHPFAACYGSTKAIMPFFLIYTKNRILLSVLKVLSHRVPAFVYDFAAVCTGRKPQLQKAYDKLDKFGKVLSYFTSNEFDFEDTNTRNLWKSLNEVDKMNFNFDISTLNWSEYYAVFLLALREYIAKEYLDNLDQSRAHFKRLKIGFPLIVIVVMIFIVYVFYKLCSVLVF